MRIIEPQRVSNLTHKNNQSKKILSGLIIVALSVALYFVFIKQSNTEPVQTNNADSTLDTPKKGVLKQFSGQEFLALYNSFAFPNTQVISEDVEIYGDKKTDDFIKKLAENRGYVLQRAPIAGILKITEPNMLLQPRAAAEWQKLKTAANKQSVDITITAGYRSETDQRGIFLSRLKQAGVTKNKIISGSENTKITSVLESVAPPGYSRHHSGYAVDIGCKSDPGVIFEKSLCFEWLSKSNYKNAKGYGWIPSYPDKAKKLGPEPEAWEYVWVSKDSLTE